MNRDVAIGALDQLLLGGGSDQDGFGTARLGHNAVGVDIAEAPQRGSEPEHTEISPIAPPATTNCWQTINDQAPKPADQQASSAAALKGRLL
jgi:hypothetical protein